MPAGERARKRRAAQAALSVARPARRLRAGITTMRLPAFYFLLFAGGESIKSRFVQETDSTAPLRVFRSQQHSGARNRAARTIDLFLHPPLEGEGRAERRGVG
jgi:hypothetical protein